MNERPKVAVGSVVGVTLLVTLLECPGVFAWMYLEHAGHQVTATLALVVGETLESGLLFLIALAGPLHEFPVKNEARVRRHVRKLRLLTFLAIVENDGIVALSDAANAQLGRGRFEESEFRQLLTELLLQPAREENHDFGVLSAWFSPRI